MDLKALRESRGLSQEDLARALGLTSKAYISQIENGVWATPLKLALKIEAWSEGEIRAVDLLEGEEAALLRACLARSPVKQAA